MSRPDEIVRDFLLTLQADDVEGALSFLHDDVDWINVSLPTVHGKRRIEQIFKSSQRLGGGFRVHFHAIASEGDVVLTERTDALTLGRFEHRFWVMGRFELRDDKIVVWRDSFDWANFTIGFVRALAGVISPRWNRRWPTDETMSSSQ